MTNTIAAPFLPENFNHNDALVSDVELKQREREKIWQVAGDKASIQGSNADAAQIILLALGKLVKQLQQGQTVDQVIASDPVFALCIEFAEKEAAGSMKVPFKHKPEGEALSDIIARSNAVAELYS